jgi:hypothetical protein
MSTPTRQILIACEEATILAGFAEALASRGLSARTLRYAEVEAALDDDEEESLVVVPALAAHDKANVWTAVAEALACNFELIQHFVRRSIASKRAGHVVALLPATAAMGDPSDAGTSALTGGMLSLIRTLTLEFMKLGMTANAVLFERHGATLSYTEELAMLVETLVAQPGHVITGQSIYACAGTDAGRLHP